MEKKSTKHCPASRPLFKDEKQGRVVLNGILARLFQLFHSRKGDFTALAFLVFGIIVLQVAGITCPIKFITGISCPGCGMTRAWLSLLRGDIGQAFAFHPLFLLPLFFLLIFIFKDRIQNRVFNGLLFIGLVLFLLVYFMRLLVFPNEIVVFAPQNGAIAMLVKACFFGAPL